MIAGDVMTPDPETVTPEATVSDAWDLMRERGIRHVPVVDKTGALVGMLSDRDLLIVAGGLLAGLDPGRAGASPVVGVMSTDVLAVDPDTDVGDVVAIMLEERVGAVPVVRAGTRDLVGIISYVDLLAAARPFFEEEE